MKHIIVWLIPPGPNPWKVIFVLEELNVPYKIQSFRFEDVKKPPYININPNGRVPAIEDLNTGITLWESGAIVQYLIKQYDTQKRLSYDTLQEQHLCEQWLMFQVSGQGPYFGQCGWFTSLHHERLPSAIERYSNEVTRILGVLEKALSAKQEPAWLVGDHISYADIMFVPWNNRLEDFMPLAPGQSKFDGFPHVQAWHERMIKRPSWTKAMEIRDRLMEEQGLDWNGMPKGTVNFKEYQDQIATEGKFD